MIYATDGNTLFVAKVQISVNNDYYFKPIGKFKNVRIDNDSIFFDNIELKMLNNEKVNNPCPSYKNIIKKEYSNQSNNIMLSFESIKKINDSERALGLKTYNSLNFIMNNDSLWLYVIDNNTFIASTPMFYGNNKGRTKLPTLIKELTESV
jgi:hypothetical protein